jgi:quercetin dioxygenase-like cupin family protein
VLIDIVHKSDGQLEPPGLSVRSNPFGPEHRRLRTWRFRPGTVKLTKSKYPKITMDKVHHLRPEVEACQKEISHVADLNNRPFVLKHNFADHPLFSLDRLAQLATFLRSTGHGASVLHRPAAVVPHTMGAWDNLGDLDAVAEVIRGCGRSGAWVALHDSELDPEYRDFLHDVVRGISRLVGRDLLTEAKYVTGVIFIGSPGSVTDFHIDSETNFLFVISGGKHFNIFDGDDPSVLSQAKIEDFYWGKWSDMRFDQALGERGMHYYLTPGEGVHSPVNFPHWVQNGSSPCIALSVLLYLPENVDRAHAFQANWLWRRLGLRPSPIDRTDHAMARRRGWLLRAFARDNPIDKRDVIASGRMRLVAPLRRVKRLLSPVPRGPAAGD